MYTWPPSKKTGGAMAPLPPPVPTPMYSNCNWQSMLQCLLSGSGSGPPIWKTLVNALESSGIREFQCIAHFLQARLHGMYVCMSLKISVWLGIR